jgi:hypothetical protein
MSLAASAMTWLPGDRRFVQAALPGLGATVLGT